MTDQRVTTAVLVPLNGAGTLRVGCVNGAVFPEIVYSHRVAFYKTGATYRFDTASVEVRNASVSPDGTRVWPWMGYPDPAPGIVAHMQRAKRLRVQVGRDFMDFDLAGAREALSRIRCR